MKYFAIILLALVAFTASASQIPRSISNGKQLRTQKEIPVNRWYVSGHDTTLVACCRTKCFGWENTVKHSVYACRRVAVM